MDTLTELYNTQIVPLDDELEKEAAVMVKQAEEEEFAGRIMARGFADELNKLAAPSFDTASPIKDMGKGTTIKSKGYGAAAGGSDTKPQGRMGEGQAVFGKRTSKAPGQQGSRPQAQIAKKQNIGANKGMFGAKPGVASQFSPGSKGGGMMGSVVGTPKPAKAGSVVGNFKPGKMPSLAAK